MISGSLMLGSTLAMLNVRTVVPEKLNVIVSKPGWLLFALASMIASRSVQVLSPQSPSPALSDVLFTTNPAARAGRTGAWRCVSF